MNRFFVLVLIGQLFALTGIQSQSYTFQKTYGGNFHDIAYSISETVDGGYIFAGQSATNYNHILIVKTDAKGDTLWSKLLGDSTGADFCNIIRQTSDGGFILAGTTFNYQPLGFGEGTYLIKLDSTGEIQWSQLFYNNNYSSHNSEATDIIETSNGFTLSGWSSYLNFQKAYILEVDFNGDILTYNTYGDSTFSAKANCIASGLNDRYVIAGKIQNWSDLTGGNENIYVANYNNTSDNFDNISIGGDFDDEATAMAKTGDGYIITGYTKSYGTNPGESDIYLLKLDETANIEWMKTYGNTGYDVASGVKVTSDGGFIVTGETNFNNDIVLLKADENGIMQWAKHYGYGTGDGGYEVQQTSDNGFIICGSTNTGVYNDFYVIKTDSLGISGCFEGDLELIEKDTIPVYNIFANHPGIEIYDTLVTTQNFTVNFQIYTICETTTETIENIAQNQFQIFPNPVRDELNVRLTGDGNKLYSVSILNIFGEKLYSLKSHFNDNLKIKLSEFSSGVYFVNISDYFGNLTMTYKIIIN